MKKLREAKAKLRNMLKSAGYDSDSALYKFATQAPSMRDEEAWDDYMTQLDNMLNREIDLYANIGEEHATKARKAAPKFYLFEKKFLQNLTPNPFFETKQNNKKKIFEKKILHFL